MESLTIRRESPDDYNGIYTITKAAFLDRPYAGGDEQDLVNLLRSTHALSLSLVATLEEHVVGHIAFSPAINTDDSGPWYAIGPVSVRPDKQRQGIGIALILEGLKQIKDLGAIGCILTGNPTYYQRFGFVLSPDNVPAEESKDYFMVNTFKSMKPVGTFQFDKAFYSLP